MTQDTPTLPPKADPVTLPREGASADKLADKLARFMDKMDREMGR